MSFDMKNYGEQFWWWGAKLESLIKREKVGLKIWKRSSKDKAVGHREEAEGWVGFEGNQAKPTEGQAWAPEPEMGKRTESRMMVANDAGPAVVGAELLKNVTLMSLSIWIFALFM